jgi:predicted transcriptional regulator
MQIIVNHGKAPQRQIAQQTGLSIRNVNYCLKALINIGFIKIDSFNKSTQKINYAYILTPKSIQKKPLLRNNLLSKRNKNTINLINT